MEFQPNIPMEERLSNLARIAELAWNMNNYQSKMFYYPAMSYHFSTRIPLFDDFILFATESDVFRGLPTPDDTRNINPIYRESVVRKQVQPGIVPPDYTSIKKGDYNNRTKAKNDLIYQAFVVEIAKLSEIVIKATEAYTELPPLVNNLKNSKNFTVEDVIEYRDVWSRTENSISILNPVTATNEKIAAIQGIVDSNVNAGMPGIVFVSGLSDNRRIMHLTPTETNKNGFVIERIQKVYWDDEHLRDKVKPNVFYNIGADLKQNHAEKILNNRYLPAKGIGSVDEVISNQGNNFHGITNGCINAFNKKSTIGKLVNHENTKKSGFQAYLNHQRQVLNILEVNEGVTGRMEKVSILQTIKEPDSILQSNDKWDYVNTLKKRKQTALSDNAELIISRLTREKLPLTGKSKTIGNPTPGVININLNKPMIENFSINTNNINEGVNDFRHKVEEVLLEILNSANVIQ